MLAALASLGAGSLAAQTDDLIQEARSLAAEGGAARAAERLAPYLLSHPEDGPTWWFRAQLLAEAGDPDGALADYAVALPLLPEDPWLRLEYGRLLLQGDRWREVPSVVGAVPELDEVPPQAAAQAYDLLASVHSWSGDRTRALEEVGRAVELDPENAAIGAHLAALRNEIRPWGSAVLDVVDDDQPFRRSRLQASGAVFLTPNMNVSLEGSVLALDGVTDGTGLDVLAGLGGTAGGSGFDFTVGGGAVSHSQSGTRQSSWQADAQLGLSLPREIRLAAGASRVRYLWTASSADTLVMVNRLDLGVSRNRSGGWGWEVVLRGERYEDGNTVRTAYGWVLAPLTRWLRLGYSLVSQDSDESRWTEPGIYDPYFTPEQLVSHSVLAELAQGWGRLDARLNVNYGFLSQEQAPVLVESGSGGTEVAFYERSFDPLTVTAALVLPTDSGLRLALELEHQRNTFYEMYRARLVTTYRWGGS